MTKMRADLKSGFTLPELLITIVIISLISASAIELGSRAQKREQINAIAIPLAGWLEQVRKASLLGAGCTVSIYATPQSTGVIAFANIGSSSSKLSQSTCIPPLTRSDLDITAKNTKFEISSSQMDSGIMNIAYTPRGTIDLPKNSPSVNMVLTLQPDGPSRCISIKGLVANLNISKGDSCGSQERF